LQPAEHLWPLTNAVLANRRFATIEELEELCSAFRSDVFSVAHYHQIPSEP
jgi:hypothetical protein